MKEQLEVERKMSEAAILVATSKVLLVGTDFRWKNEDAFVVQAARGAKSARGQRS